MAKKRSSYETYSARYDEYAAKHGNMIKSKLSEEDFNEAAELARRAGIKSNIARSVVSQQRYFSGRSIGVSVNTRRFERAFENYYGEDASTADFSDKDIRHEVFKKFIEDAEEEGMTHAEAQRKAIEYFY